MSTAHFDQIASSWDSEPRRVAIMRAIGEAILGQVELTRAMHVLDYGCGTGLVGLFLLPHVGRVTGADNSPGMLKVLREKISAGGLESMAAMQLDLEKDPAPNRQFDMIVVGMAMHHIADTQKVLRAFRSLLAPGGLLCLADLDTEPGTFHPAEMADIVHHHGFDRQQLRQQLVNEGFSQVKDSTALTFSKPVEGDGEQEFSIFLIIARRAAAEAV